MICCIDGGLICVPATLAIVTLAFKWIAKRVWRLCKRDCKCNCHTVLVKEGLINKGGVNTVPMNQRPPPPLKTGFSGFSSTILEIRKRST